MNVKLLPSASTVAALDVKLVYFNVLVSCFTIQLHLPPSPLMRLVRHMSDQLPSQHDHESFGYTLKVMRSIVPGVSKFLMSHMMVRTDIVQNVYLH